MENLSMSRSQGTLALFLSRHASKVALAAAIAASSAVYYGSLAEAGESEVAAAAATAPLVEYTVVQPVDLREWNSYSGRLSAVASAEIKPLVGGTIMQVLFDDGQLVKAGDPLFVIDPRPHQNAASQAEAAFATAKSRLQLAQDEFARNERLHESGLVSDSVFDTAHSNLQVAEAGVLQAQSALDQARLNLEYAHISAPISGRVSRAELTVGNVVDAGPNAPVLTSVVSDDMLYAEFNVDEQTYIQLARSQQDGAMPVELSLAQDENVTYQGEIHSFDNRLDSQSGTIRARAIVANTDGVLTPGLYVNVRVGSAQTKPVLLVPERAIGTNQSRKFVYVVDAQNLVQYREVTLGSSHEGHRVVLSGIEAGDHVVVNGTSHIAAPNTPVNPVQMTADQVVSR
jgi:multidrug efflux system membrane fusion protein